MKTEQIINQLLNGNHLNDSELKEAKILVDKLQNEVNSRLPHKIDFTRVNNDVNGNPRYVCHFLNIDDDYATALKKAKAIGGKKYHNKKYGGGVVFQSYNINKLEKDIKEL